MECVHRSVGKPTFDHLGVYRLDVGSNANIGSFSGAQSLNDLVPLIYNAAVVMLGVGMMAIGAAGFAGRGPMRGGE